MPCWGKGTRPLCLLPCVLLLLLSHFSRVRLCVTPQTAAHQAPSSLGFSRQEHWSGLPFPSPMHESESEVAQSCPTLSDPMDCSLPGSSIHGVFQATVLEWSAIAFSVSHVYHSVVGSWLPRKGAWLWSKQIFLAKAVPEKGWELRIVCQHYYQAAGEISPFQKRIWLAQFSTYHKYL